MSDSVRPHRPQSTRLPHPRDSPGKNTGVGCHFLLQCMKGKSESEVTQSCPTLCNPMDCSPPGSSIHGVFQARVLEWGAIYNAYQKAIAIRLKCNRDIVGPMWYNGDLPLDGENSLTLEPTETKKDLPLGIRLFSGVQTIPHLPQSENKFK